MRRPAEKRAFDKRVNNHPRCLVIESPQPGGLRQGELQAGHFDELVFHTVHESMKVHAAQSSNTRANSGTRPRTR